MKAVLVVAFLSLLVTSVTHADYFKDEFNGATLDTARWTVVTPCDYSLTGDGVLNVTVSGNGNGAGADSLFMTQAPDGDYTATLKIQSYDAKYMWGQPAVAIYNADHSEYVKLGYVFDNVYSFFGPSGRGFEVGRSDAVAGEIDPFPYIDQDMGLTPFWMQIQKTGSTFDFRWSQDGSTFTSLGTLSPTFAADLDHVAMWFGAEAIDTGTTQHTVAHVDSFEVTPEPATMSLLVIGGVALLRKGRKA